jgi:cyclic-di-GMP phosphodiesterase TipF (flagellum assembly factor)
VSGLAHLVFALGYTVAAVAVALGLRQGMPGTDRLTGLLAGATVFLFGALMHEVAARHRRDKAVARWLARLRSGDEEIAAGLDQLHGELRALAGLAAAGGQPPAGHPQAAQPRSAQAAPEPRPASPRQPVQQPAPHQPSPRQAAPAPEAPRPEPPAPAAVPSAAERASLIAELRSLKDAMARARPADPPAAPARVEPVLGAPPRDPDREHGAGDEAALAEAVRATLTSERIEVMLQPIVTLPQRKHRLSVISARLRLGDGRLVGPEVYQPAARRGNVVAFIDNLLLFRCLQFTREAERRGQPPGVLCAVSPDALDDEAFTGQFVQFMAHNRNLASRLGFVLPQAELLDRPGPPRAAVDELAGLGFRFAMDAVAHLEFDAPDLVRRHVRTLVVDAALLLDPGGPLGGIDSALALKHELDRNAVDLVVSGIRTEQQLVELLDLRPDLGQGPLFGDARPLA